MSRGDRAIAPGNLSSSMRENYGELGVSEVSTAEQLFYEQQLLILLKYYKRTGSTYRNPHFPGIRLCMFLWLNRFVYPVLISSPRVVSKYRAWADGGTWGVVT
jgi:hypothetical protein